MPKIVDRPLIPISARVDERELAIAALYLHEKFRLRSKSDLINACVATVATFGEGLADITGSEKTEDALHTLRKLGINWDNSKQAQRQISKAMLLDTLEEEGYSSEEMAEIKTLIMDKRKRKAIFDSKAAKEKDANPVIGDSFADHM